jgi:hypothetical protein
VAFTPKYGYVEAGTTSQIQLKLLPNVECSKTKLLVKLVVLKKALLAGDFDRDWQLACKRNGEVKKIIDVVHDGGSVSPGKRVLNEAVATASHRNATKQLVLTSGAPGPVRLSSMDSADASSVSDASCLQSIRSEAFYSPSVTSECTAPSRTQAGHQGGSGRPASASVDASDQRGHGQEHGPESPTVQGSVFDFDGYSLAESALEDSGVLSDGRSEHHSDMQREQTARTIAHFEARSRSTGIHGPLHHPHGSEEKRSNADQHTEAVVPATHQEQKAVLDLLHKIAHSPGAATLLAGLLRSADAAASAVPAAGRYVVADQQPAVCLPAGHEGKATVAPSQRYLLSRAELQRRFVEAEGETFPSVRRVAEHSELESEGPRDVDPVLSERCSIITPPMCRRGRGEAGGEHRRGRGAGAVRGGRDGRRV